MKKLFTIIARFIIMNKLSDWDCRELFTERLEKDGKIAVYWSTVDIIERYKDRKEDEPDFEPLTEKDAMEILSIADNKHDANEGINWITLDVWTDYYLERKNK